MTIEDAARGLMIALAVGSVGDAARSQVRRAAEFEEAVSRISHCTAVDADTAARLVLAYGGEWAYHFVVGSDDPVAAAEVLLAAARVTRSHSPGK